MLTVGHLAIVPRPPEPTAGADAAGTAWHPIAKLLDGAAADALLAFDHGRILADGVERAQSKLEYTTLAAAFCPPEFTVTQLRRVYEAVWRRDAGPAQLPAQGHLDARVPGADRHAGHRRARAAGAALPPRPGDGAAPADAARRRD